MSDKRTNPYKEPQALTYEEHKQIESFFSEFYEKGNPVFNLLRKSFGDKGEPVKRMAKAINLLSNLHYYCETRSCYDRPKPLDYDSEEFNKWHMLYRNMKGWITTG